MLDLILLLYCLLIATEETYLIIPETDIIKTKYMLHTNYPLCKIINDEITSWAAACIPSTVRLLLLAPAAATSFAVSANFCECA